MHGLCGASKLSSVSDCLQGLAMLITVSIFDWRAEAKRAMLLLDQHERAVDGEEDHELLNDEVSEQ